MAELGELLAGLKGRFPGEEEESLPRVLATLISTGQLAPPSEELLSRIHSVEAAAPEPEASTPEPEPAREPEAATPEPEPAPEPEATAPEPDPAPEPEAAAPEAAPAPEPEAAPQAAPEPAPESEPAKAEGEMPEAVERAFDNLLAGNAESGIFSAVAAPTPAAADISARLPAISESDGEEEDEFEEDEDDDLMGALMRGGEDEDLGDAEDEEEAPDSFDGEDLLDAVAADAAEESSDQGEEASDDDLMADVLAESSDDGGAAEDSEAADDLMADILAESTEDGDAADDLMADILGDAAEDSEAADDLMADILGESADGSDSADSELDDAMAAFEGDAVEESPAQTMAEIDANASETSQAADALEAAAAPVEDSSAEAEAEAVEAEVASEDEAELDDDDEEPYEFDPEASLLSDENVENMLVGGDAGEEPIVGESRAEMPDADSVIDATQPKISKATRHIEIPEGSDIDSTMSLLGLDNDPPSDEFEYSTVAEVQSTDTDMRIAQDVDTAVEEASPPSSVEEAPITAEEMESEAEVDAAVDDLLADITGESPESPEDDAGLGDMLAEGTDENTAVVEAAPAEEAGSDEEDFDFDSLVSGMTGKLPEGEEAPDTDDQADASAADEAVDAEAGDAAIDDIASVFDAEVPADEASDAEAVAEDVAETADSIASGIFGGDDEEEDAAKSYDDADSLEGAALEGAADELLGDIMDDLQESGDAVPSGIAESVAAAEPVAEDDDDPFAGIDLSGDGSDEDDASLLMDALGGDDGGDTASAADDLLNSIGGDDASDGSFANADDDDLAAALDQMPTDSVVEEPEPEPVAPRKPQPAAEAPSGPRVPKKAKLPEDDLDEALRSNAEAHTMILKREDVDAMGAELVGPKEISLGEVLVGVTGIVLTISAAAIYLWYVTLTGGP